MKILILGSGGREHALAWRLAQDKRVKTIFCAPGNPAIPGHSVDVDPSNHEELIEYVQKQKIDFTIVGPEAYLFEGVVDRFRKSGLTIFGPTQKAAEIERSKIFAKDLMIASGIPTADSKVIDNMEAALEYVEMIGPCVVKAPGPALGKGAHVCHTFEEAKEALEKILVHKEFGEEPALIEEFLVGSEASFYVMTDGENILPLPAAQDHKTIYEGDQGPMTGGMGAYAPTPLLKSDQYDAVLRTIVVPLLHALKLKETPYTGVLFVGLMITATGPKVIEFNCRFGDPETQPLMMLWEEGLLDALLAASGKGNFEALEGKTKFYGGSATCVVMASKGYPQTSTKGCVITGLNSHLEDAVVFHAGTKRNGESYVTNGGRVLGVTAKAETIQEATEKAYRTVDAISFEGAQFRRDIGYQVL